LLKPILPAYEIADWKRRPFPERLRMVCQAWAEQGYGSPASIYLLYLAKIAGYVGVWVAVNAIMPGRDLANIETWWATPEAFGKAIVWTMLFEGLGLGCGSGPLTGRYVPPIGGALYFLRPGTTKLPLFPKLLGHKRTLVDVLLYAVVIGLLVRALLAPALTLAHLLPLLVAVPLLGVLDKTLFLVFRSEHYLSSMVCLCFPADWIAGNKVVWLAIWWWAATSKLNAHFPAVMCVMTSNAPWTRVGPLRRWVYRDFPHDLRPSRFASWMAHTGTVAEYLFPLLLVWLADSPPLLVAVLLFGTTFHLFIMSNVPMGVPLEWNVIMIYGAWALFGAHADVGVLSIGAPALWAWLLLFHLALPLYGSFYPGQVSFLLSMRYYAGNWAYSVWLFKVVAFRAMHLHGRALHQLLPRAVDDIDRYTWLDGEIVAGMVVGWNFGDGHLHDLQLMHAMQEQCRFEPGELRCIFVESQPLLGSSLAWVVADASTGVLETGQIQVSSLVEAHPWPAAA
jgi:hypothetical protein